MSETRDINSIFCAAIEVEASDEREAYLEKVCGGDSEFKRQVERLLSAHFRSNNMLDALAGNHATEIDQSLMEKAGDRIGPYRLLELLGEGGMGRVHMAEQQEPVRRIVALKIIKPGMDSQQVIARFEAERQALAMMDHNNISRVLDANTTDRGRPYFVMELVKGIPITDYCDKNQLGPLERLKLFNPVCNALQHAHQKGVVHRDIKPTNVLVTQSDGQPVPKVIDFGIAKATAQRLTDHTMYTSIGQILGTLEYMSPEQADVNQIDIDTRSDVYSLGVLLFELLTGSTPIKREQLRDVGLEEMLRKVRETEPPKPSTRLSESGNDLPSISAARNIEPAKLSRFVRGDLDWIVMKALEKQRTRRYETASALARDIERYLNDQPVEACPPSAAYRFRKFVHKNRRALAVVAGFAALLFLAAIVGTWQAILVYRADVSRKRVELLAETNRQRADIEEVAHKKTQAALASEQRHLYFNRIVLAERELLANNIVRVKQLLGECPKDLRQWEWHYLNSICEQQLFLLNHDSPVNAVVFSPDGEVLASATYDRSIYLWNVKTRSVIRTLKGHSAPLSDLEFSPDGKRLFSSAGHGSEPHGEIKVWDVESGVLIVDIPSVKYPVVSIAVSPNGGRYVAFAHGALGLPEITIWDVANGSQFRVLKGHRGPVTDIAFSADGQQLVSAAHREPTVADDLPGEFRVWNVSSGEELFRQEAPFVPIRAVTYSPDGEFIATAGVDGLIRVWNATTGDEEAKLSGHRASAGALAYVSQNVLASGSDDCSIRLWNPSYEHTSVTLRGHTDLVSSLAVDPHRNRIVSASGDGTVRMWDTSVEDAFTLRGHKEGVDAVVFSPDGKTLATGSGRDGVMRLWDAESGLEIYSSDPGMFQVNPHSLAFSPDGKSLAACRSTVSILDSSTGQEILECVEKHRDGLINAIDYSPDGKHIASLSMGDQLGGKGEIVIWDATTGKPVLRFAAHKRVANKFGCIRYSRDGTRLISASTENTVRVWNASTGAQTLTIEGHNAPVIGIAISPNNQYIATASDDNNVKLWAMETGNEVRTLKGHTQDVISVAFSPDGQRLISGANDHMVKLWDVESGEEAITLRGHKGRGGVAFSQDGQRVAAGSADTNVRLWSMLPLRHDVRSRRQAGRIVNDLAAKSIREDVIAAIEANEEIDSLTRQHAMNFAVRYQENASLHFDASVDVITRTDASPAEYEAALRLAQSAFRLAPHKISHRNMVGMGQYRVGYFRQAVEMLTATDAMYTQYNEGGMPYNLAYLAMAYYRLGEQKQALETLDRLHRMMMPPPESNGTNAVPETNGNKPKRWDYTRPEFELYRAMHKEATDLITPANSGNPAHETHVESFNESCK